MAAGSQLRSRVVTTLVIAAAHLYLATLAHFDLLNFTQPTVFRVLTQAASTDAWMWIHASVGLLLVAVLLIGPESYPELRWLGRRWTSALPLGSLACSVGFAAMTTWAFFYALWGLTAIRPVTLAGPGLAIVVALGEQLLANAWSRGSTHSRR